MYKWNFIFSNCNTFNLSNQSYIKSEERIDSIDNKIETITNKESINKDKTKIQKIHVVKIEIQFQVSEIMFSK